MVIQAKYPFASTASDSLQSQRRRSRVSVWCYDAHGGEESNTSHHLPLGDETTLSLVVSFIRLFFVGDLEGDPSFSVA